MKSTFKKRSSFKIIAAILVLLFFVPSEIAVAAYDSLEVRMEVIEEIIPYIPPTIKPPSTIIPLIYELEIKGIGPDKATVEWKTNKRTLCHLYYGETEEHSKASISEQSFSLKHSIAITGLFPATVYYFKITCIDIFGTRSKAVEQSFKTLALSIILPINVTNLEAIPGDEQIELKWKNPVDPNFEGVRIVRSKDFYPSSPWDKDIIYEGKAEHFIDTGLENGTRYYYTVFSYDKLGNFSSGIIISAIPTPTDVPIVIPPPPPVDIPVVLPIHPDLEKITIDDFYFYQKGERVDLNKVEPTEPLLIFIEYDKVPEILKTIMVTLTREDDP